MRVPGVRLRKVAAAAAAWDIMLARRERDAGSLVEAFVKVARQAVPSPGRFPHTGPPV
jgi:hypothetical protein